MPSAPPASASKTLSVSSWRTRSPGDAPSARRTAISRERDAARASWRLATLAQAISSTRPTAPSSTNIARRIPEEVTWSLSGDSTRSQSSDTASGRSALIRRRQGVQVRLGLLEGDAVLEAGRQEEKLVAPRTRELSLREGQRRPDVGVAVEHGGERGRHHADHFVTLPIEEQPLPDDRLVGPIRVAPETGTQHHDVVVPGRGFIRTERPAERGLHAKRREVLSRPPAAPGGASRHRGR